MPGDAPILEVGNRRSLVLSAVGGLGECGCIGLELVGAAVGLFLAVEWAQLVGGTRGGILLLPAAGLLAGALAGPPLVTRWLWPRAGRVAFFDDRLVFTGKQTHPVTLPWDELVAFRDDSSDYVRLVVRQRHPADRVFDLTIPTPDESSRTAVLELLADRGLRRE